MLLPEYEAHIRLDKVQREFRNGCDAILVTDNANLYYLTGRVFSGWAYLPAAGEAVFFVQRPVELAGANVVGVRKPEQMAEWLRSRDMIPGRLGLELDLLPYNMAERLRKAFEPLETVDCTPALRQARSRKTEMEIAMIRQSGVKQTEVYSRIPSLFTIGMTDYELDVAIEHLSRQEGCLGQFRISGSSMEFFMGNILAGENADYPCPYDFALGGKGMDPSLPVGASGDEIKRGMTVMVDENGNYTGYMTDMTRVFSVGEVPAEAQRAHQLSIDIHDMFRREARPGVEAKVLYEKAVQMVADADMAGFFMGHRQHAGFIGHGVGIEINELPVIAPKSHAVLAEGNVIALEPKFVIPHVGAVGIENTYVIRRDSVECLTNAPENIIPLED